MARSRNTADTQTASGGPVSPFIAGKNAVINGGMDIWQRGTSFTNITGLIYTADRFQGSIGSMTSGTLSISQQASGLDAFEYALRFQRNSGATTTGNGFLTYSTETRNVIPLQNKAVTFSFYARKGANYSMASSAVSLTVATGTGTDVNANTGNLTTTIVSASPVLTTSWQRFTYTATVSSTALSLGFFFQYTGVGTAGANDYFEVTGVQLEQGSYATTFSRAGGTIAGELAACQRYYWRAQTGQNYEVFGAGNTISASSGYAGVNVPVTMRVVPTSLDYANLYYGPYGVAGGGTVTSLTIASNSNSKDFVWLNVSNTGNTADRFYPLFANSTAAYVGFSAEL